MEDLVKLFLPEGLLDFFELVKVESKSDYIIYLDEKNLPPQSDCVSKGFYSSIKVQDFPIRGRAVYLVLRKRKWLNKSGQLVNNSWELAAKGTRMTKELAAFLKAAY